MNAVADENGDALIAGRYQVEGQLGQGGMATVYEVVDRASGARLALKLLREGLAQSVADAFDAEYQMLAGLRHPCIVRSFDYGSWQGRTFYTMELLRGDDLAALSPLPWREVCGILRDAASLLGVLHARRMVHRDLTPRNLWRTPSGRIKLLDFGTVTAFGRATKLIGTPPFVPPEAVDGQELDQRSDLYALGALGYWLLCGSHAYRATRISDLRKLWEEPLSSPSAIATLVDESMPEVPQALDELVLSLLRLDPAERPTSTVDVIDRLNDIAGLEPEAQDEVARGYLDSQAFVGRARERGAVDRKLEKASAGNPACVVLQGSEGMGRSRLLREIAAASRVHGATTLLAGREAGSKPYAVASALALELLGSMPEVAMPLARAHASALRELSVGLREKLDAPATDDASGEAMDARARKQLALAALFQGASQQRAIALLVDDVDLIDEESQALLAALVRAERGHRICVVVTCAAGAKDSGSRSLRALLSSTRSLALPRLSEEEMLAMLQSIFGDVPYLNRFAARLHALSEGNPGRCMVQVEHLVHTGVVQYAEGSWRLPNELRKDELPTTVRDGLLAVVDRLDPRARRFAARLSVPDHGALSPQMAHAVSDLSEAETQTALRTLCDRGVLSMALQEYSFQHAAQREKLQAELSGAEAAAVHTAMARTLMAQREASEDSLLALRAGLHWLRADELDEAEPLVFEAGQAYMQGSVAESLRHAAPMFADAVELLRHKGRDDHALLLPLAVLAYAGYFVDRGYADRYGPEAIEALSAAIRLPLARRLRPYVGGKLSMIFALVVAGLTLRSRKYAPRLAQLIYCLVSAATTTAAAAAVTMHPTAVRAHSRVLHELSVLRSAHVVRFLLRFTNALALVSESRVREAQHVFRELAARLEDPSDLTDLPAATRIHYLAHSHALHGLYDAWSCKPESLVSADKAASYGPFHAMWGHQVRGIYYGQHGEIDLGKHSEAEVERLAIQLGGVWQVETWTPIVALMSLRGDAVATKRAAEQMASYGNSSLPHFHTLANFIRAAYLVLRGNHRAAVELIDAQGDVQDLIGWSVVKGWLATALNHIGEHRRALEVCRSSLARLGTNAEVIHFSVRLEVELAIARAGLGEHEAARADLDALLQRYVPASGRIVGGYLYMERVRLALMQQDLDGAQGALDCAAEQVLPLGLPSMTRQLAELRNAHAEARGGRTSLSRRKARASAAIAAKMLETAGHSQDASAAERALRTALKLVQADHGFVLLRGGEVGPRTGPAISEDLLEWARLEQMVAGDDGDTDDLESEISEGHTATGLTVTIADASYRIVHLWRPASNDLQPMASLVLGQEGAEPETPPADITALLARFISDADEARAS